MENKIFEFQNFLENFRIVDLSHTLESDMPSWPTHPKFFSNVWEEYKTDVSTMNQLIMGEHTGTHIDAPLHFIPEGPAHYGIDQISLWSCFGRCVVISCIKSDTDDLVSEQDIVRWESENGKIAKDDIVIFNYHWSKKWDLTQNSNEFLKTWPGLSLEAAKYLSSKEVKVVGSDTLSIDVYGTESFPVHKELLKNEILILENLDNLDRLPSFCFFMGFPLKIRDGSGSPIRAVAFIDK